MFGCFPPAGGAFGGAPVAGAVFGRVPPAGGAFGGAPVAGAVFGRVPPADGSGLQLFGVGSRKESAPVRGGLKLGLKLGGRLSQGRGGHGTPQFNSMCK